MARKNKIERKLNKQAWLTKHDAQNSPVIGGNDPWEKRIKQNSKDLAELICDEDEEPQIPVGPVKYVPSYSTGVVLRTLALPQYKEYAIHYMGLPGYVYRHLRDAPRETIDKVYELARLTREAGADALRTFMMNGSRARSEKYMFEALPWQMVKGSWQGKQVKQIDFSQRNDYYFECCQVIEDACKYWDIKHRPTIWMDRYNYDIFDERFNVQGVNGFRSAHAQKIKINFMIDYFMFQMSIRGIKYDSTFEIENEPTHHRNHELGGLIADQNLEMFRALQDLGMQIEDLWTCSGGSEFSHANFVGEDCETFNRCFGSDEFKSRLVKPEYHEVSTLQSLWDANFDHGLSSGWKQLCFNEDAANVGSYSPIPWTNYKLGNYVEVFDMLDVALRECKAHRGKRFFFTMFMMDCLELDEADGIAKETYLLHEMNWKRTKAYPDVRKHLGW